MPLRLSPEDQAEYNRLLAPLSREKEFCVNVLRDAKLARKARQAISALYKEFEAKQLPPPPPKPPSNYQIECSLTIEQRLDRIEQHLKIGHYKEGT